MESKRPGGAVGPQGGRGHHFKVKFSGKDSREYTVDCDQPCTVLEEIQTKQKYKQLNYSEKNLVIQLGKGDDYIVATHFPSSCVKSGEVLTISSEPELVEDAKIQPATAIHSRDRYSVFYIDTVGGTNAKTKKIFTNNAVKKFKYLCVYGEKGTTVEEALQRDGRFSDDVCNFTLSNNENPDCLTEPVDNVDSLNGNKFKICLPRKKRANDKKQQENTGASHFPQNRRVTRSTSVLNVVHQRGKSVRAEMKKRDSSVDNEEILRKQLPVLNKLMQSRFPGDSYQKAVELRKEDFGKIQQSFSEVHRVKKLLKLGESVCKVIVKDGRVGTGFVLFDNFILTNAHLFGGCVEAETLKKDVEVYVLFNYDDPEPDTNYCYFQLANSYIYIKEDDLDYAVLELNTEGHMVSNHKTQTEKIKIPPGLLKHVGPMSQNGEACLIGHPGGDVKKMDPTCIIEKEKRGQAVDDHLHPYKDSPFILHSISHLIREQGIENIMIGGKLEEKRSTYNTFMYHGSSGSPVFDAQCKVFGLHTGGYVYGFPNTHIESVIEYAQPLCTILKHFVNMLKTKRHEELLKRFKEAAMGNSEIQKVLKTVSEA
ncbi:protein FAM111A-like [Sparus aurata]|uniref:protein FAM111A-like n=1 Tax=Sparus aurata TaxID=8175 RepID=UPI0011C1773B|nr:protein FAM111A-like [Sparus aurata]XP_030287764.1 protein FAM111A-like [Sparus aurata]